MGHAVEAIIFVVLLLALLLVPSVVIAFVGSRLCRRIKSPIRRLAVRRLILSFAFTPSVYPHGPALAWWILILGSWSERTYLGALPIVVVWTIGVLFGVLRGNKDITDAALNQPLHPTAGGSPPAAGERPR